MKTVDGDLIALAKEGKFDVIAHGCNCFCTMGAGLALQIKRAFPAAYEADLLTTNGDDSKLGRFTSATVGNLTIVNCYTQYAIGYDAVDYKAIESVMWKLADAFRNKRIGLPKIGAGLAGGDWKRIEAIIEATLAPFADVTIVNYVPER